MRSARLDEARRPQDLAVSSSSGQTPATEGIVALYEPEGESLLTCPGSEEHPIQSSTPAVRNGCVGGMRWMRRR